MLKRAGSWKETIKSFGLLVGLWLSAFVPLLNLLALAICLPALIYYYVLKSRWVWAVVFILANPLAPPFVRGVVAWGNPDAFMASTGLLENSTSIVHSFTRLPIATSGCIVNGKEWVTQVPYNFGLITATLALGKPSHAYAGPIPSESEARQTLDTSGVPVDWTALVVEPLSVEGRTVHLQEFLGPALLKSCYHFDPLRASHEEFSRAPEPGVIVGALWNDAALLIEMKDKLGVRFPTLDRPPSQIAMVDVQTGKVFGYYGGYCMGLPIPWSKLQLRPADMNLRTELPEIF